MIFSKVKNKSIFFKYDFLVQNISIFFRSDFFNTKQIYKIGLGTKIIAMNPSIDIMNG